MKVDDFVDVDVVAVIDLKGGNSLLDGLGVAGGDGCDEGAKSCVELLRCGGQHFVFIMMAVDYKDGVDHRLS